VTLLRGRNKPTVKLNLRWASEYLTEPLAEPTFPIDVREHLVELGMMGNDTYGDCGPVAEVHLEMTTAVAAGGAAVSPDSPLAVNRYVSYTGSETPPGPGVDLASYLLWCYQRGYIKAFAPVDQSDKAQCQALMAAGFGLVIGVNLTDENEQQFANGQPFDASATEPPNPDDGHAVLWGYSETANGPHAVATWALWQPTTDAWINDCLVQNPGGEAFLVVTTEEQLAAFDPALLADVAALGGTGGATAPPSPPEPPSGAE